MALPSWSPPTELLKPCDAQQATAKHPRRFATWAILQFQRMMEIGRQSVFALLNRKGIQRLREIDQTLGRWGDFSLFRKNNQSAFDKLLWNSRDFEISNQIDFSEWSADTLYLLVSKEVTIWPHPRLLKAITWAAVELRYVIIRTRGPTTWLCPFEASRVACLWCRAHPTHLTWWASMRVKRWVWTTGPATRAGGRSGGDASSSWRSMWKSSWMPWDRIWRFMKPWMAWILFHINVCFDLVTWAILGDFDLWKESWAMGGFMKTKPWPEGMHFYVHLFFLSLSMFVCVGSGMYDRKHLKAVKSYVSFKPMASLTSLKSLLLCQKHQKHIAT